MRNLWRGPLPGLLLTGWLLSFGLLCGVLAYSGGIAYARLLFFSAMFFPGAAGYFVYTVMASDRHWAYALNEFARLSHLIMPFTGFPFLLLAVTGQLYGEGVIAGLSYFSWGVAGAMNLAMDGLLLYLWWKGDVYVRIRRFPYWFRRRERPGHDR